MASETRSKKRKRASKNNTKTCLRCRQRHEKCDGGNPCGFCLKTDSECIYIAPKRRGPRPGYRKKYSNRIAELESIVKQQQEELKQYRCGLTPSPTQVVNYTLSPSNVGVKLVNANIVLTYVDALNTFDAGHVVPMDINRVSHAQISPDSYHIYAVAALGAFVCGHRTQFLQLDTIAKSIETQVGHQLHPKVAAANVVRGSAYFMDGQMGIAMELIKRAKKHITLWATSNSTRITRKERSLIHTITWHETKFMRGLLRFNATDEICTELLTFCEGQPSSLCHKDQALLALCLTSQVMHKVTLSTLLGKSMTASEKTNCLLRIMQAETLRIDSVYLHLRVLVLVARCKYQLMDGNRGKAHKTACVALNYLNALPNEAFVRVLLSIRLFEVFACIDAPNEFIHCLNMIKTLSKKWRIGGLILNIIATLSTKQDSDPLPAPVVPTLIPQKKMILLDIDKIGKMLKNLSLQGYDVSIHELSSSNDEDDTLGSDPQEPIVDSGTTQQPPAKKPKTTQIVAQNVTPEAQNQAPQLPPGYRFSPEQRERLPILSALVASNPTLAKFILTADQKKKLAAMGGIENVMKLLKKQIEEDEAAERTKASTTAAQSPIPHNVTVQSTTSSQSPSSSPSNTPQPMLPTGIRIQAPMPSPSYMASPGFMASQNLPVSVQGNFSPLQQPQTSASPVVLQQTSQPQPQTPLSDMVFSHSNSLSSFSSHQDEYSFPELGAVDLNMREDLGFDTVPLESGIDNMEVWQQSLFPGSQHNEANTEW